MTGPASTGPASTGPASTGPASTGPASTKAVVAVVGPTGVGKSDVAVDLALALAARGLSAEIINTDAMQLYRGMDIGTAKLTAIGRRGVVHHLLDVLDVTETATVAEFQTLARAAVAECHARGVVPIAVGGSALYVRALLDDLRFPGTDPAVRAKWEARAEAVGPAALHAELADRDPVAAHEILPSNTRRVVRALEVIEITGQPFAATMPARASIYAPLVMPALTAPRDELDQLLDARVARMFETGLVAEVESLRAVGLEHGTTAPAAIGYRQVLAMLRGEIDEHAARQATVEATRRFARRQDRAFRTDPRTTWRAWDDIGRLEAFTDLVETAVRATPA